MRLQIATLNNVTPVFLKRMPSQFISDTTSLQVLESGKSLGIGEESNLNLVHSQCAYSCEEVCQVGGHQRHWEGADSSSASGIVSTS